MDGLIPMVFKAIKKNKTRRQYDRLSSGAAQSYNIGDFYGHGHQNSAGHKLEKTFSHRRHKSVGDIYLGYAPAAGANVGGGGGSPPPRAKQVVRFGSRRMFSCVTGC